MAERPLILVVEGITDLVVLNKLLSVTGIAGYKTKIAGGKANILKRISEYNKAIHHTRWLIVVDLDQDAECAPEHFREILPFPNKEMELRIAVNSIESWIMADRMMIAQYLGIHSDNIPIQPDSLGDPKAELLNLIERKCRRSRLRQDMLPTSGSKRKVGARYTDRFTEFVQKHWRPEVAANHSDSLRRAIICLKRLVQTTS